jgi:hypothetical protein
MKNLFLLVILTSILSTKIYACDCAEKPSVTHNFSKANQVFIGKIIKMDSLNYDKYGQTIGLYTLEIIVNFKGEEYNFNKRKFRTIASEGRGSCDYHFQVGKTYLIYAKDSDGMLSSSICSRTEALDKVEESELEELKQLQSGVNKASNGTTIVTFKGKHEDEKDLIRNALEEKLKRKNILIYILSASCVLLLLFGIRKLVKR